MVRRSLLVLMVSLGLGACSARVPGTLVTGAIAQTPGGLSLANLAAERLLARGVVTLPATLVSVGSGSLVSTGSAGLVSTGSAQFRLAALATAVPVRNAIVALVSPRGQDLGITRVFSDARGRYALGGHATAGVYRVEAHVGHANYLSLVALQPNTPVDAPIDDATTLVATRLLASAPDRDLAVLPVGAYTAAVAAVREALDAHPLPAGWTPEHAAGAIADLERQTPGVRAALGTLQTEQQQLEKRFHDFGYRLASLSSELGVPATSLVPSVEAALSHDPQASDEEVATAVKQDRAAQAQAASHPASAPSPAASAPTGTPRPSASPTAAPPSPGPTPTPAAATAPATASGPAAAPTPLPTPTPVATPTPTPTPLATPEPVTTPEASPAHANEGQGNQDGQNHTPSTLQPAAAALPQAQPGETKKSGPATVAPADGKTQAKQPSGDDGQSTDQGGEPGANGNHDGQQGDGKTSHQLPAGEAPTGSTGSSGHGNQDGQSGASNQHH